MLDKERIDKLLVECGLVETCSQAERLILCGEVYVNAEKITKPAKLVEKNSKIEIKRSLPYVSRGGIKLEKAINEFKIQVKDRICLDVGASTGGFTDCLLKHGAKLVYALDVGYGQLDWSLRNNSRVVNIERTNIRYFDKRGLAQILERRLPQITQTLHLTHYTLHDTFHDFVPDLATVDVSFISLEKVLLKVCRLLKDEGEIIALIKPQFEAGRNKVKKGVVKDKKIHEEVIEKIKKFAESLGLIFQGIVPSPLKGPKGNIEYFMLMKKIEDTLIIPKLKNQNEK